MGNKKDKSEKDRPKIINNKKIIFISILILLVVLVLILLLLKLNKTNTKLMAKVGNVNIYQSDIIDVKNKLNNLRLGDEEVLSDLIIYHKNKIAANQSGLKITPNSLQDKINEYANEKNIKPIDEIKYIAYPMAVQDRFRFTKHTGVEADVYFLNYDTNYPQAKEYNTNIINKAHKLVEQSKTKEAEKYMMQSKSFNNKEDFLVSDIFSDKGYPLEIDGDQNTKLMSYDPNIIHIYLSERCKNQGLCKVADYQNKEDSKKHTLIFAKRGRNYEKTKQSVVNEFNDIKNNIRVIRYEK